MPRYIDADLLKEQMYHEAFEKTTDMQRWDSGCWIRYKMFENVIASVPTADVVDKERYVRLRENAGILSDALSEYQSADMVEVVRCRDCIHHKNAPQTTDVWCERLDGLLPCDWFCADGERGEDVEETD